jgi:hypothetical protein
VANKRAQTWSLALPNVIQGLRTAFQCCTYSRAGFRERA